METPRATIFRQGIVAGLVGVSTVAAWFAILNVIAGRPALATASLLGSLVLGQTPEASAAAIGPALLYSAIHLLVFVGFGLVASWLAAVSERGYQLWYVGIFVVIFIGFHLFGAVQTLAHGGTPALSGLMVWGAGATASLTMMAYLLWRHPSLRRGERW